MGQVFTRQRPHGRAIHVLPQFIEKQLPESGFFLGDETVSGWK